MLPGEELPSVVVMLLAIVVAEVVVPFIPGDVVVVKSAGVEVIFIPAVVVVVLLVTEVVVVVAEVVLLIAEVVVAVVIPVGAAVGGTGQSHGSGPNSLPVRSGPKGDSSNPQNRPYHK